MKVYCLFYIDIDFHEFREIPILLKIFSTQEKAEQFLNKNFKKDKHEYKIMEQEVK